MKKIQLISIPVIFCCLFCVGLLGCRKSLSEYEIIHTSFSPDTKQTSFPSSDTGSKDIKPLPDTNGTAVHFFADSTNLRFYHANEKDMSGIYAAGVNIGLSSATTDLSNPDVSYDTYLEWFELIYKMNANTVRAFTEMPPQFYQALYDFNSKQENNKVLYLIQGIWFNEDYLTEPGDCFDSDNLVISSFNKAVTETLDIIHGNANISYGASSHTRFSYDVSKWTLGYILGLEWNNDFVTASNTHTEITPFSGKYLTSTSQAAPFESFLCEVGDKLIDYETTKYNTQTPVAFLNWSTTDVLKHDNEPDPAEDLVSVNTENIKSTDSYYAGLFAAVDAYPYYPEGLNYQEEYCNFTDPVSGGKNNYKAYIDDLKKTYTVPLLIAEYGLPTSRGLASESTQGYNQGNITEEQQGQYVSEMTKSIADLGCAGGLIFSWQDEWFKQTWNTFKYYPPEASLRTTDRMSAEQNYGILAMEPGTTTKCIIDGKDNEWSSVLPVSENDNLSLSAMYDEAYLYLKIVYKNKGFNDSKLLIPISTIGIGSNKSNNLGVFFDRNTDFLLLIDGKVNSALYTDNYYDYFQYRFKDWLGEKYISQDTPAASSGNYSLVRQFVTSELKLPKTGETIPPIINEAGRLRYGISDPDSNDFDSLSDFYAGSNCVEVRIAWSLLNVLNCNTGAAINSFNSDGKLDSTTLSEIYLGADFLNEQCTTIFLSKMDYSSGKTSSYHTRVKKSYSYIQAAFGEVKKHYETKFRN